jgi:orotate phosphoribosyltransferase
VIGLDRKERGKGTVSAIQEVERQFNMSVVSIIDIDDILTYLSDTPDATDLIAAIGDYRDTYGTS